ncbi:hypothetical protein EEL31_08945 [Brevibacillus laterosporus]|nr:hypothetical protein [Brevibacillus laterosporus]TPG68634.1 hypothetical protein EEL31_08945 [Brevibacillus laterosporus]
MSRKILLQETIELDTGISWWDTNRKRLNEVITCFNDWQTVHRFDNFEREVVIARISSCRKYGAYNSFSKWQYELLDEMENWVLRN